jgi:hypothetical protein
MVIFTYFIIIQKSIAAEENPVFGDININPLEPTPLSVVSFTIGVNSNVTVEDVRLIVQECAGDMCFANDFNVSMNYSYTCCMDFYETQIKFIHEDATQIKYYVKIFNNGTWYYSNTSFTNFSIPVNNNPLIISENRSIPGFELVLLFFSAGALLMSRHYKLKEKNK